MPLYTATATRRAAARVPVWILLLTWVLLCSARNVAAQPVACGAAADQWCPAPPGDPCGQHTTEATCRVDRRCKGLPYRGESVVPCRSEGHGFSSNCPAVGCISTAGRPATADLEDALQPLWKQLPDRTGWRMLVSPAVNQRGDATQE